MPERSKHIEPWASHEAGDAQAQRDAAQFAIEALARDMAAGGDVERAQLWFVDEQTGSYRNLAGTSPRVADREPIPVHGGAFEAVRSTILTRVTAGPDGCETSPGWRLLIPLHAQSADGIALVDFVGARPDQTALEAVSAAHAPLLAAALAVTLASHDSQMAAALVASARTLVAQLDPEAVASSLLDGAVRLMGAHTGSVMLVGEDGELHIVAAHGLPYGVLRTTAIRAGEGVSGWVHATGKPVVIEDLARRGSHGRRHGVRSAISVPIRDAEGALGVLNVGSRVWPARSMGALLSALETLGELGATALQSARAAGSTRGLYFETLTALVVGLETKDPFAHGATDRVVDLTTAMGTALDLSPADAEALRIASLLHDIGMSAAGDVIAMSSRPLSTVEHTLLKMHPLIAADILRQVPALERVVPIVFHHHEHYDGRGYIAGLAGEAIPLGARILSVADAFVAMTSDRPYRRARTEAEALEELRSHAGTQFDPAVVDTLAALLCREEERPPRGTAVEHVVSQEN